MVTITNFREDQYPATDETQCVKVYIPAGDEYKQLLAGLLALPQRLSNYQDPDSVQADGVAAVWQDAYDLTDWNGCGTPPECSQVNSDIALALINNDHLPAGAIAWTADVNQRSSGTFAFSPANNGASCDFYRFLAPGSWSYRITYKRQTTNGIMLFGIATNPGGSVVLSASHDLRGATLNNSYATGTFTVPETDDQKFTLGVSANSSSGAGFAIPVSMIEMWKTA